MNEKVMKVLNDATSLKTSDVISANLLIAIVLKGLPSEFKLLTSIITQKDKMITFREFKGALCSFEETVKMIEENKSENTVMALKMQRPRRKIQSNNISTCYIFGKTWPTILQYLIACI